ncbi:bZIP transcription factor [Spirosoma sp. BT702]|uniref:BZIP transcription factor n=1 Tax=Spirosoma profusum TaxID=2771354 RepID=A0A926Y5F8_9BACT|nr:bZIP transcription factor [Spirosoma profusum]MBD2704466.1 bZIP transcription factor [Spirosoma profusum]
MKTLYLLFAVLFSHALIAQTNTFLGRGAGVSSTTMATNNTFIGHNAGRATTSGINNSFLGEQAGFSNTSGLANVFIGFQTGYSNTTGLGNLFMGQLAGYNSNGSYNMFIGNSSGQGTTSGSGNTFIGNGSGYGNTTGQNNTYIGNGAGFTGNGAGQSNTFIGQNAGVSSGAVVNNSTAIGAGAQVSADNSIVLGAPSPLWKVGIGNTAPNNKLEITHGTNGQSGLRFTNLKSSNAASATNQTKVLSVNENGDVILVSTNASTREGVTEVFWQRKGSFLQSIQDDAVVIGSNVARTPAGYKLFVEQGILTEKVKVAVKNTSEWSDKVFDDTYQLKGLSEVENYIKLNKHLPGIPSAQEMVEKGNDLHKTDAKLLEKIEELTLYSIQLEKADQVKQQKIQQLEAEVGELKKQQQQFQNQQAEINQLKKLMKQLGARK